MNRWCNFALAMVVFGSAAALAQTDGVSTKRTSALRDGPGDAARTVVSVPADTPLTRLPRRQGAWVEVRLANGTSGWIHMFDLGAAKSPSGGTDTAAGALRGLSQLFGGIQPAKTTVATHTIGIRGLGAEDIAQAQPNLQALKVVESYRQDAAQAQRFAASVGLQTHDVLPLPVPELPRPGTPQDSNLR